MLYKCPSDFIRFNFIIRQEVGYILKKSIFGKIQCTLKQVFMEYPQKTKNGTDF